MRKVACVLSETLNFHSCSPAATIARQRSHPQCWTPWMNYKGRRERWKALCFTLLNLSVCFPGFSALWFLWSESLSEAKQRERGKQREREKGNAQVSLPLLKKTLMPSWESAITTSSDDRLPKACHPSAITVDMRASSLGRQTFIRFIVFHMSLHPWVKCYLKHLVRDCIAVSNNI